MKFYKRLPINRKNPTSDSFVVEPDGRISTDTDKSVEIPDGPSSARPSNPRVGMLRFNTELNNFEAYFDGIWQPIKAYAQTDVVKQVFENGDYADTIFGPLTYDIPLDKPQNILVYVENVPQIADLNYSLVYGTPITPHTTSTVLAQPATANTTTLALQTVADFNPGFTITGSGIPSGTTIVASSGTTKTITLSNQTSSPISSGSSVTVYYTSGTYVKFSNNSVPVPFKPVITLLGLDGFKPLP
jgi:hypothetical protein